MTTTNNLAISFLEQSQSQKEVTINEALVRLDAILNRGAIDKDIATPPVSPVNGDTYIIAATATGDWFGKENQITFYHQGWKFIAPQEGLQIWVNDEDKFYVFDGSVWQISSVDFQNIPTLGVNTIADATNKLSVNSSAILFNNIGNSVQVKINKVGTSDSASILFQDGFSGRAEIGCLGSDDFTFKVSPDGSSFYDSIVLDKNNGNAKIVGNLKYHREIITVSGNKTLAISDESTIQNVTALATITVPNDTGANLSIGTKIEFIRSTSQPVNFIPDSGVTINSVSGYTNISAQNAVASLMKISANNWVLFGDLS
jgi:hypothetical protein